MSSYYACALKAHLLHYLQTTHKRWGENWSDKYISLKVSLEETFPPVLMFVVNLELNMAKVQPGWIEHQQLLIFRNYNFKCKNTKKTKQKRYQTQTFKAFIISTTFGWSQKHSWMWLQPSSLLHEPQSLQTTLTIIWLNDLPSRNMLAH